MHVQAIPSEILWRRFEIYRASLAAAGKSQARFMASLLTFLIILWGLQYMKPGDAAIQFLGVAIRPAALWMIAPVALTLLVLGLIGSMNIMGPIWKRLRDCAGQLGEAFFWTDLDPNKTIVDFFTHLMIWPEGPVEPFAVPSEPPRFRLAVFSYPAVITFATFTTALADYPHAPCLYRVYVYSAAILQGVFSFRIWYRAVCRFFGLRKDQTEI